MKLNIQTSSISPLRVLIYGEPGVGKTTLAASLGKPLFIDFEGGLGKNSASVLGGVKTYEDVIEAIRTVHAEKGAGHDWLVIDSITALEAIVNKSVCDDLNLKDIKAAGYGREKGPIQQKWAKILAGLNALKAVGVRPCLVGHSARRTTNTPGSEPFDRSEVVISAYAGEIVLPWPDVVLFGQAAVTVGEDRSVVGKAKRLFRCDEQPWHLGKSRVPVPAKTDVSSDEAKAALVAALNQGESK